jgi:hypothetical protein
MNLPPVYGDIGDALLLGLPHYTIFWSKPNGVTGFRQFSKPKPGGILTRVSCSLFWRTR